MELILDTADVKAIKELNELLTIEGVTTNPTIITKSNKTFDVVVKEIIDVLNEDQKLFIQAVSTTCDEIVEEAKYIHSLREKNMYVKIPVTHEGLKAIKKCKALGLNVLATAIYSADQAFLAALNGADYLAPYVNRMDNYGDGVGNVKDLIQMIKVHNMNTKIIAASFKNTRQVHELISAGIQSVTVPADIAYAMINHPGTQIAVDEFSHNWQQAYGKTTLR
ncbi:MAG: fructose-6-phosphate aldolase [Erysipelotrichia bacterium]|nr:fructose-6-phosphate aldolase [Erysipelotrichia bacterium]NCC54029.1 fructose-6-phosphate aldolase [Erysipelotrichia bacterium]